MGKHKRARKALRAAAAPAPSAPRVSRLWRLLPPGLFGLAFLVFLPSLWNGFVDWDDDRNLVQNPHYRGLGWEQLTWMFGGNDTNFYMPLTWLTYGLDYALWGMNPAGYHLTSLILHALSACVFYFVALRLFRTARGGEPISDSALRAGAALAALFFALHPLRVESVVWATERRDVLSGLFYLLAILAYLRALEPGAAGTPRARAWYWGAVAAGLCALLSKPMAVSLPVVLVLLDIYPLKRLGFAPTSWITPAGRRAWLEKVPFILPAAATSAVTLVRVGQITDLTTLPSVGWLGRLAISLYALAFYLWKTLVPRNLSPLYEQPVPLDPIAWPFLVSAAAVLAVAIAALAFRRRWPALPVVGAAYVVVLLPVLGIVQVQTLIAGDRYTYLACLGWALLAGGLLTSAVEAHAAGRLGRDPMAAIALLALALPIVLGALTWTQTRVWRDSETLWARALAVTPSPRAHLHLGTTLVREGRPAEAIPHLRETLRLQPDYADAHLELGIALAAQGNLSPAIEHYREALRLSPRETLAYYNLGVALVRLGKPAEAIQHYEEALRLYPAYADARINLGIALLQANRPADAIAHFRTALDSDPRNAQVHNLLGIALAQAGRLREAAEHFREALRLHPEFEQARANLAQVLDVERRQLQ